MPAGWAAAAAAAAGLASGYMSSEASKDAASKQASAANRATDTQLQMFNTVNNQQLPFRQAGNNALQYLLSGLGAQGSGPSSLNQDNFNSAAYLAQNPDVAASKDYKGSNGAWQHYMDWGKGEIAAGTRQLGFDIASTATPTPGIDTGQFTHQFNAADLNSNLAPNYQFQLDQGLGALKNAGNLQTGLISGNTLKGVNDYAQNFAGNSYQQAYNNYNSNQSNIFNRLASIAGLGQTANQATGNAAVQTGANVGNSQMAAGAAQAAGIVGGANAMAGGLNNAASWYTLSQVMKNNNTGGGDG